MSSRDEILSAIRQNTRQKFEYPQWALRATTYADPAAHFCQALAQVGGQSVMTDKDTDINALIREHFPQARRIGSVCPEITCATFNPDNVERAQDLDGTDVAIVSGEFGVAENGAVWIPQTVRHKALYFIAESLVILLERSQIVHNMHGDGSTRSQRGIGGAEAVKKAAFSCNEMAGRLCPYISDMNSQALGSELPSTWEFLSKGLETNLPYIR